MDANQLSTIIQLREPESLKIDFKAKFYDVRNPDRSIKEKQWNELVKDILAIANGNIGTAGQDGFLIIGIADKLNSSGTRDVFDIEEIAVTAKQILDKVNSFSKSQLPDLHIDSILFQGKNIWVITIPPSPYLYETSKPLVTSTTIYHENSVFIRRKDGIAIASLEECEFILAEKKSNKSFSEDLEIGIGEDYAYDGILLEFQNFYDDVEITDMFVQVNELFVSRYFGKEYFEKIRELDRSKVFFNGKHIGKTLRWNTNTAPTERITLQPNESSYVLFLEKIPDSEVLSFGFDATNPNDSDKKISHQSGTYEVFVDVYGKIRNEVTYRKRTFVVLVTFKKGIETEIEHSISKNTYQNWLKK